MFTARTVAALAIAFFFAQGSFAVGLIPKKGQRITFEHSYTADELKNRPLQFTKKTAFTVSNSNGMITGTWKSTMRSTHNDETFETEATSICRPHRGRKLECAFGAEAGTVYLTPQSNGDVIVAIPSSQGVAFDERTEDGMVPGEYLLGTDDDNNLFRLRAKKSRR